MTPLTYHSTFHLSVQLTSESSKEHWKSLRSRIYLRVFPPWFTSALIWYISISCISTQQSFSQHSTASQGCQFVVLVLPTGMRPFSFVVSVICVEPITRPVIGGCWMFRGESYPRHERETLCPHSSCSNSKLEVSKVRERDPISSDCLVRLLSRLLSSPVRLSAPRTSSWAASS